MFVPVVDQNQQPLMPTTPSRARRRTSWSPEEDATLQTIYGRRPYREIYEAIPGRHRNSIKGRARKLGLHGNKSVTMALEKKMYTVRHDYFHVPTLQNSYWAGFIAADGCISPECNSVKIQLQIGDSSHLRLFAKHSGYNGPIRPCQGGSYKPESPQAVINVCGVPDWICDLDSNYSVTAKKSLVLLPPVSLSGECALSYVIGYIDGDGSIGIAKGRYKDKVYIRTVISVRGTTMVLQWINGLLDDLTPSRGRIASVRHHDGHAQYRVAGQRADAILSSLRQLDTPKLERKWL